MLRISAPGEAYTDALTALSLAWTVGLHNLPATSYVCCARDVVYALAPTLYQADPCLSTLAALIGSERAALTHQETV
jgi:hypothetical protein